MKTVLIISVASMLFFKTSLSKAQQTRFSQKQLDELSAVIGSWKMEKGNGTWFEEWKRSNNEELSGKAYKISNGVTTPLENVRVYLSDGKIVYAPTTAGQNQDKEVSFPLKEIRDGQFIFENREHDFPQRIMYHVVGNNILEAYIEGELNGKTRHVDFKYVRQN
jgi:hypothetical protein